MRDTVVYCDKCNAALNIIGHVSKSRTNKIARENGWSIGEKDLCPDCRNLQFIRTTGGNKIRI